MFVHTILCPQTKDCPAFNMLSITDIQVPQSSIILTFHSHINAAFRLHDLLFSNMVNFQSLVLCSFSYFLVTICLVPVCQNPTHFLTTEHVSTLHSLD